MAISSCLCCFANKRSRELTTRRVHAVLMIFTILAGLMVLQDCKAQNNEARLIKIHVETPTQYAQLISHDLDFIEIKSDFVTVFASGEQVALLERSGWKIEYLSLAEVIDEQVLSKADAGLYHTYAETVAELQQIETAHGNIAKLFVIGKSLQGRGIYAIKLSDNPGIEEADEPEVLYMGCHHAREWISVEMPMFLVNLLVDSYGVEPELTRLVNERETWIVPIVNPDGLEYSQKVYTMWRKNMRDNNGNQVFERTYDGVDLNRNYGYKWGYDDFGSSPYPGSEIYRGKSAFSEPETRAVATLAFYHDFVFSISYHSYGELMIYPWGYTSQDTPHDKVFTDIADRMAQSNGYIYGNLKDGVIYETNGGSDDWLYATEKTLAYTFELGTSFIPPENQIEQIWLKNKDAALLLLQIADDPRQIYPSIRVYTDSTEYSRGEEMKVGLKLTNPEKTITVGVGVWVDLPYGEKYWIMKEIYTTIPEGFSYDNPAWKSYILPSLQPGNYSWHAIVVDPLTIYVMSQSQSEWVFKTE